MNVQISLVGKVKSKKPILFEGFPGIGLVGTIATSYLVEQRKMNFLGYITSGLFPPLAAIHEGRPMYPARIYEDAEKNIIVLFSEFVIPFEVVYELAQKVLEFSKKNMVSRIVSLAGMTSIGIEKAPGEGEVYGIATSDDVAKFLHKNGVKVITEGATTGVSGVILAQCAIEKIPAMSLLAETAQQYPDPRAAAILVKKINDMFGLKINTAPLMDEAEKIEKRMRGIMEQTKILDRKYRRVGEKGPEVMYG